MKKYLILLSVGKDRPGIVDDISTFLFERGANIEDSRMAAMGGCFSIMTLFSCSTEESENIESDLSRLRELGLEVSVHQAEDPTALQNKAVQPLKIAVTAMDHPGIVQPVVHALRRYDVNIQALNTRVVQAPLSGAPLFDLSLEADVPAGKSIAELKEALTGLAAQMNLDITFK